MLSECAQSAAYSAVIPVTMRKSSVLCCALCFLLSLITDTGALSFWGPPDCARSWISDGVKDYNEIAKMFFPEANMPGRDYNYRCVQCLLVFWSSRESALHWTLGLGTS